jgi:hypothetical protein
LLAEAIELLQPFADEADKYAFLADVRTVGTDAGVDGWADEDWLADTPSDFKCGDLRRVRDFLRRIGAR